MGNLRDVAKAVEQRSKQKLARGSVKITLPLYGGAYAARFGVLDPDKLESFYEKVQGEEKITPGEAVEIYAQFIADACRQLLAKDGGKWEPLTHDDGRHVRFDEEFAETLALALPDGEAIDSMSGVVRAVWTVDDGDGRTEINVAALNMFSLNLAGWMGDTTKRVEGEIVGESSARPSS